MTGHTTTAASKIRPRLEVLALELNDAGYDVACVSSGPEAVGRTRTEHFDLVLTDFKMPGMDGLETLAALEKVVPNLRAVVMTGFASEDLRSTLKNSGLPLVQKPFDVDQLLLTLRQTLGR
jgi:CheY-like chemotaxis protein